MLVCIVSQELGGSNSAYCLSDHLSLDGRYEATWDEVGRVIGRSGHSNFFCFPFSKKKNHGDGKSRYTLQGLSTAHEPSLFKGG